LNINILRRFLFCLGVGFGVKIIQLLTYRLENIITLKVLLLVTDQQKSHPIGRLCKLSALAL